MVNEHLLVRGLVMVIVVLVISVIMGRRDYLDRKK